MVSRSLRHDPLRTIRRLDSSVRSSFIAIPQKAFDEGVDKENRTKPINVDAGGINLDDTKELFSSLSTSKLIRSLVTLRLAAVEYTSNLGSWAMHPKRMSYPLWRKMVLGVTEHSFYDHFCAGKDLEMAAETVERIRREGLYAMLDYGMEHAGDNESCDGNMQEFIRTIEWTGSNTALPVSFVVVKITAICPPSLLKRVSDLLRWEHKDRSFRLPWKLKTLPLFSESSPLYHTMTRPDPLTPMEEHHMCLAYERMRKICKKSISDSVPLLIDAEDTAIQPAIDYLTYSAAIEHATGGERRPPLIYNTIQAYLKDAKERMVAAKKAADWMGVPLGFKLVRGAYMSSENRLAHSLGVESPVHDSIQNTHDCYNQCAEFLLQEIAHGSGSAVLATHNIESGKLAARKAADLGIERSTQRLQFAQLYGMAEALSFGLRNAGFRVSKYLPFGPVEQIIPYLLRRAEENRGLLSTSVIDRKLMSKELIRRIQIN